MLKLIPWYYKALAVLLLLGGLFAAYHFRIEAAERAGFVKAMKQVEEFDNKELLAAHAKVALLEKQIADAVQAGVTARAEEKLKYATSLIDISARIADGSERMRCPAVTVHTPAAPGNPTNPGRPTSAEAGYLMPGTVAVIQRIARTDYENVRDYNALADLYNKMRAVCNAK